MLGGGLSDGHRHGVKAIRHAQPFGAVHPKQNATEFFGFLGIARRALAFLGPLVFGGLTKATGSQRPAVLAIAVFFLSSEFFCSRL